MSFCGIFGVESERIFIEFEKTFVYLHNLLEAIKFKYKQRSGLELIVEESREFVSESDSGKLTYQLTKELCY